MNTPSICSESPRAVAGLDVSKDTLDVCLLADGKRHEKQFVNDKVGHRELLRWSMKKVDGNVADQLGPTPHFCMEATGSYGQGVASFLMKQQQVVSIINPARIRFFGLAQNAGNKTDKADARLIALYCLQQNPATSRAHAPEIVRLQAFVRRIHALNELIVQEKNRVQVPGQEKEILASNKRILTLLEKEKKRLQTQLRTHVSRHEKLHGDIQLLQSIPGIGEITAWDIMAEMPDVQEFASAQSAAAYAGLSPREQRSGSSVRKATHLSKRGNARLRKSFYFPAVSAIIWNPLVKAHYQRLREKGKPKMVALAACMRKLLMICYGVLRHQQPFDPLGGNRGVAA